MKDEVITIEAYGGTRAPEGGDRSKSSGVVSRDGGRNGLGRRERKSREVRPKKKLQATTHSQRDQGQEGGELMKGRRRTERKRRGLRRLNYKIGKRVRTVSQDKKRRLALEKKRNRATGSF